MKRAGFTMIELIFVIVILGILAAVAIPKLAATRDDATVSNVKATVNTAVSAIPSAYMGSKVATFSDAMTIDSSKWVEDATGCIRTYEDDDTGTITMTIAQTDGSAATGGCLQGVDAGTQTDSNLTLQVVFAPAATGTVYTLVNDMNMTDTNITLGGNRVVY